MWKNSYRREVCLHNAKGQPEHWTDKWDRSWWSFSTNNLFLRFRNLQPRIPHPRRQDLRRSTSTLGLQQWPRRILPALSDFSWAVDCQWRIVVVASRRCDVFRHRSMQPILTRPHRLRLPSRILVWNLNPSRAKISLVKTSFMVVLLFWYNSRSGFGGNAKLDF